MRPLQRQDWVRWAGPRDTENQKGNHSCKSHHWCTTKLNACGLQIALCISTIISVAKLNIDYLNGFLRSHSLDMTELQTGPEGMLFSFALYCTRSCWLKAYLKWMKPWLPCNHQYISKARVQFMESLEIPTIQENLIRRCKTLVTLSWCIKNFRKRQFRAQKEKL